MPIKEKERKHGKTVSWKYDSFASQAKRDDSAWFGCKMGVAAAVLSFMGRLGGEQASGMLGIGLACLALCMLYSDKWLKKGADFRSFFWFIVWLYGRNKWTFFPLLPGSHSGSNGFCFSMRSCRLRGSLCILRRCVWLWSHICLPRQS